jgi:hypothetical protein
LFFSEKLTLFDYLYLYALASNTELAMYIDENLEIAESGLNGSISEVSDEDENEDEFVDVQLEPLDSDLAEQSLFIFNNKNKIIFELNLSYNLAHQFIQLT